MISNELINHVLKIQCIDFFIEGNDIWIEYEEKDNSWRCDSINIYEFTYKCKEFASICKYAICAEMHYSNSNVVKLLEMHTNKGWFEPFKKTFKTEPEAIFKACKWILDNKDKK